jgi:hypothetical protein
LRFEVGRTYWYTFANDTDTRNEITITRRTARTVFWSIPGEKDASSRIRIGTDGVETCFVFGRYSMAPTLRADRVKPEASKTRELFESHDYSEVFSIFLEQITGSDLSFCGRHYGAFFDYRVTDEHDPIFARRNMELWSIGYINQFGSDASEFLDIFLSGMHVEFKRHQLEMREQQEAERRQHRWYNPV